MDVRWLIYGALGGAACAFSLLSKDQPRYWFTVFLLALQLNVSWYLVDPYGAWVGVSGPTGVELPLVTLVGMVVLALLAGTGRARLRLGGAIAGPLVAIPLVALATMAWTPERRLVAYSLVFYLESYIAFLVGLNAVRRPEDVRLVLRILIAIIALQSAVYFVENAVGMTFSLTGEHVYQDGPLQRHGGTVSTNSKGFSMFITPLLLVAVAWLLAAERLSLRLCLVITAGAAALILTFTRASWAGFLIGLVWIATVGAARRLLPRTSDADPGPRRWQDRPAPSAVGPSLVPAYARPLAVRRRRQSARRLLRPGRLLLVGLAAVVALALLWPKVQLRLADDLEGAYDERSALMQLAWRVIEDNPVLGVGDGAYPHVFRQYLDSGSRQHWLYVVHNAYLLRWAETGIIGLCAYVWFLFTAFRQALACTRSQDVRVAALSLGWSAGVLSLAWEMWWDLGFGVQTQMLFFAMLGVTLACRTLGAEAASAKRLEPLAPPVPVTVPA